MTGTIGTVFGMLAAQRTTRRRARNLRAGARRTAAAAEARTAPAAAHRSPAATRAASAATRATRAGVRTGVAGRWPGLANWLGGLCALLLVLAGAAVIASHARRLAAAADEPGAASMRVAALQPLLPGVAFTVPSQAGITISRAGAGALVVASGMRGEAPVRIDLCSQLAGRGQGRLLPLHVGYRFGDVAHWTEQGNRPAPRNVVLAAPGTAMPRVDIGGAVASGGAGLALRWDGNSEARWIGDQDAGHIASGLRGQAALGREGWLAWNGDMALRIARVPSQACTHGELLLQLYRAGSAPAHALVTAFPARGEPRSAWLAPGAYRIPAAPVPALEDEGLFDQLRAHGLVRLGATGLVELAPSDLAAYDDASSGTRAHRLPEWVGVKLDAPARALLDRLYHHADGDYVREQVRVFNSERRLLAWRVAGGAPGAWRAGVDAAPVATTGAMPPAAARLFADLPDGWGPWTRVAGWPGDGAAAGARLTLALPHPASAGDTLRVLLAGRVKAVAGARLQRAPQAACSGRACPAPDAVQLLDLALEPGARGVALDVAPLDMAGLAVPGDRQYRHLRVANGRIEWQALAGGARAAPAPAAVASLADRNGTPLWSDGAASAAAGEAGLAPLLGLHDGHANSIAGMLARLPSASGTPHRARLSIDLALQAASQAALDCIGMRHGHWDGRACTGAGVAPAGRHAGVVVVDTETGDVLAAAGAQGVDPRQADWDELRDFDRADPARSPLRLPALQHDGGANNSPGSTFKVISALGLERAARHDPQLDQLLGGLPLAGINRVAAGRGFAFRTDAAAYPDNTRLAHITNFRDEQPARVAQEGRLGLAQALTFSLNTWFAWTAELSDRSLFGHPDGGAPGLLPLEAGALAGVRPIADMAHLLGFERPLRLDGGLLPPDFPWSPWDALQGTPAHIDPIDSRHELRQMAIGLRMQVTPLQMALAAGAVGQGRVVAPRLLLGLDGRDAAAVAGPPLGVRLDRIRAGMKGVVDTGTAAGAFRGKRFDSLRPGLYGKTGTAPTGMRDAAGHELATVWFTCWLEPGSIPGQAHRLALAAFVSHSETTGGEHAAPVVAAVLQALQAMKSVNPAKPGRETI